MPSAEIFPTLKELTTMKLVKSQRTFDLTKIESMKCLCPGVVRALHVREDGATECACTRVYQCFNLIHIFIDRQKC